MNAILQGQITMTRTLPALALLLALATLTGCPDGGAAERLRFLDAQIEQAESESARADAAVQAQIAAVKAMQQQLEELPDGPAKDALRGKLEDSKDSLETLTAYAVHLRNVQEAARAALDDAQRAIEAGADEDIAEAQAVVKGVSAVLPPPWNLIIASAGSLAVGLIGGLVKEGRKRKAAEEGARSIARGVKAASQLNGTPGVLNFNDEKVREVLAAVMTPDGKRLVKEAGATVKATPTATPKAA